MCMAPNRSVVGDQAVNDAFHGLAELARQWQVDRLSMGMSGDFELAIAAGATDIRLGSTLFA